MRRSGDFPSGYAFLMKGYKMYSSQTFLITGASGRLGKATIDFLLKKVPSSKIAALARDKNKAEDLKAKGIDIRIGDYTDYVSMTNAFKGIDKLLLISSSDMTDRAGQHINAINAAKEVGVKHILYTSVDIKSLPDSAIPMIIEDHYKTVNHLVNSGLTYTLLNHNLYADVLPMFIGEKVLETGIFFPAGKGKVPFTTRMDMAEAAANVLTSNGHESKEYAISSGVAYSMDDVAGLLSELSGKKVRYTDPSKEVYVDTLTKAGVPEAYIGMNSSFAEAIKLNEFDTQTASLENLLGRKPTSLKEYLKSVYFSNN